MKRHFLYRHAVFISIILMGILFYLYNLLPHSHPFQYTFISTLSSDVTDSSSDHPSYNEGGSSAASGTPSLTPAPTETPAATDAVINVRGATIALGEDKDSLVKKLGAPFRIDTTEYDYEYYIYNNDYRRLLYVAVRDDKVIGYYTDSIDFDYQGINSGSDISTVCTVLNQSFSMSDILQHKEDTYTVQVLMDKLETKKVTGIYVMSNDMQLVDYTDDVLKNEALMVYDLTNSIRLRNNEAILTWSSSAALAASKHSQEMATDDLFSHTNLKRESPGDRLRAEGVYVKSDAENIAAGFGTAITSIHKLFNSTTQRNNILNKKFRYIGVGFAYVPDSTYQTYFTQNFYR